MSDVIASCECAVWIRIIRINRAVRLSFIAKRGRLKVLGPSTSKDHRTGQQNV